MGVLTDVRIFLNRGDTRNDICSSGKLEVRSFDNLFVCLTVTRRDRLLNRIV